MWPVPPPLLRTWQKSCPGSSPWKHLWQMVSGVIQLALQKCWEGQWGRDGCSLLLCAFSNCFLLPPHALSCVGSGLAARSGVSWTKLAVVGCLPASPRASACRCAWACPRLDPLHPPPAASSGRGWESDVFATARHLLSARYQCDLAWLPSGNNS